MFLLCTCNFETFTAVLPESVDSLGFEEALSKERRSCVASEYERGTTSMESGPSRELWIHCDQVAKLDAKCGLRLGEVHPSTEQLVSVHPGPA